MSDQPLSIAFHVGVHKTATSHLQRCLSKASDDLAHLGLRYYGPDHFRLPGRTIPALFGFKNAKPDSREPQRTPAEQLALLRKDATRLVISEENFIGVLNNPRGGGVRKRYKAAGDRLTAFTTAIGQSCDVYIAIRRPTSFINSAYGQMLMGGQVFPVGVFFRRNPLTSVDWLDLVTRIRAVKDVGRVVVWRYEDYIPLFQTIVGELVGAERAHLVPEVQRKINAGLSAAAVAEILHRSEHDPIEKLGFAARGMLPVQAGFPAFDGYSAEEHALSEAVYGKQCEAIANLDGVTMLTPPSD